MPALCSAFGSPRAETRRRRARVFRRTPSVGREVAGSTRKTPRFRAITPRFCQKLPRFRPASAACHPPFGPCAYGNRGPSCSDGRAASLPPPLYPHYYANFFFSPHPLLRFVAELLRAVRSADAGVAAARRTNGGRHHVHRGFHAHPARRFRANQVVAHAQPQADGARTRDFCRTRPPALGISLAHGLCLGHRRRESHGAQWQKQAQHRHPAESNFRADRTNHVRKRDRPLIGRHSALRRAPF